ncbi:MAG: 2TM domain-containing protein [Ostreibacterium sp.]
MQKFMLIQKLRLQHGWSQQQLAEMSGLSTRTIQRIEKGKKPSIESLKSLAAVFEMNFIILQKELAMTAQSTKTTAQLAGNQIDNLSLNPKETEALKKVKKIKKFYIKLIVFLVIIVGLCLLNYFISPEVLWVKWVIFGWSIAFVITAIKMFWIEPLFSPNWEKCQVNKYLNGKSKQ